MSRHRDDLLAELIDDSFPGVEVCAPESCNVAGDRWRRAIDRSLGVGKAREPHGERTQSTALWGEKAVTDELATHISTLCERRLPAPTARR